MTTSVPSTYELKTVEVFFTGKGVIPDIAHRWAQHHVDGFNPEPPLSEQEINDSLALLQTTVEPEESAIVKHQSEFNQWIGRISWKREATHLGLCAGAVAATLAVMTTGYIASNTTAKLLKAPPGWLLPINYTLSGVAAFSVYSKLGDQIDKWRERQNGQSN